MASNIRLICPNLRCRSLLTVPQAARGKAVRCRQCGMRINVPVTSGSGPSSGADESNDDQNATGDTDGQQAA